MKPRKHIIKVAILIAYALFVPMFLLMPSLLFGDYRRALDGLLYFGGLTAIGLMFGVIWVLAAPLAGLVHRSSRQVFRGGARVLLAAAAVPWLAIGLHLLFAETQPREMPSALLSSAVMLFIWSVLAAIRTSGRARITTIALGFVCILIGYGGSYHLVYLRHPLAFSFSGGIEEGVTLQESFLVDLAHLRELQHRQYLMTLVEGHPVVGFAAARSIKRDPGEPRELMPKVRITFVCLPDYPSDELGMYVEYGEQRVPFGMRPGRVKEDERHMVDELCRANSPDEFRARAGDFVAMYERQIVGLRGRIEKALSTRPEWETLDFCYFSAVTLTTLGYGDIVPNSRLVRLFVMSQAVMGVAYVAFTLALIRGE